MSRGIFIAIEGIDSSGKKTQAKLLVERLKAAGHKVELVDFPRYEEGSSHFVRDYLAGKFGEISQLSPYTASYFFAFDRYAASFDINKHLDKGHIVIANRFTGSNMAHQGGKIEDKQERLQYYNWIRQLEKSMNIAFPALNLVLEVPVEQVQDLMKKQGRIKDKHEESTKHLTDSHREYTELVEIYPEFEAVDCMKDGKLLSIPAISNLVWQKISKHLPEEKKSKYIEKVGGEYIISKEGEEYLNRVFTSTDKDIYAVTSHLPNATAAAAMARLSRRADDLRITVLDEFAEHEGKDEALLRRVITAYGDDSVQQLAGIHIVVEKASNLLTKKLEWGRLAAYLEQCTRYIYYDQKDSKGNYKYYTPKNLDAETAKEYEFTLNKIFDNYSKVVRVLTEYIRKHSKEKQDGAWKSATKAQACDIARALLPVATQSTVGIFASGQALESLIMHLRADELEESRNAGEQILEESRKVLPIILERADKPDRGGATTAYMAENRVNMDKVAEEVVPQTLDAASDPVKLVSYFPKNELDLLPHMLFAHSNQSLEAIKQSIEELSYDKKLEIFRTYVGERLNRRHKPSRALEQAHYSWELVCDYGIFRDLQRHRMVDDLQWQPLTPRYGYDVPDIVEKAGVLELFEQCFDLSYELYSKMQKAGFMLEAQYATLFGHRMRWKITYNARQAFHFHELRTTPQGHRAYRQLVKQMHDKLSEVHPLIGESMKFVNQGEDPELARLAAERYSRYKLKKLKG